ncbi:MarR family transcriptional regulator [Neptunomonas phycophila]|jgi:DNA-binding MarR family transcriptional regulator|uniref:MarR family transcriptional regulator n=1 Tax=Neptunomonas phycophila TaxID=1572645 RepID=A0AAW7XGE6_9GAMM|nr:MarR family transcriptional regulator [Neptunomonas phycophila]MDO6452152.1 MarR family transcriptional regulator [Neptunomonas phycophila]MDO6783116.1 MarR family transcriptional regulator [Neptunomonas phycophila]QLE97927.1 MarR family transcriptional regulator [Neptunomonas phycophila]
MQDSNDFSETIYSLMYVFKVRLRHVIREHTKDINGMHVRTLRLIEQQQPCTALDVSVGLNRDKGQITRLIKELIANGWIIKTPNPHDKRSQLLALTDQGESLMTLIAQEEKLIIKTMTNGLSEDQLNTFKQTANQLINNLKQQDTSDIT